MTAAIATQIDFEDAHRQRVIAGMQTPSFKEVFHSEFENLRKAVADGDCEEIENTIQALESCGVNVCQQFDNAYKRAEAN